MLVGDSSVRRVCHWCIGNASVIEVSVSVVCRIIDTRIHEPAAVIV